MSDTTSTHRIDCDMGEDCNCPEPDLNAVVAAARAESASRRRDFLVAMLEYVYDEVSPEALGTPLTLDTLERMYKQNYDAIWMDGDVESDNDRHGAEDYHDGFEAGLAFVLQALVKAGFTLPAVES